MREIEDALRIAERSGDDLALAIARVTLGVALVHRQTAPERDRGQKLLAEVSEVFLRRDTTCAIYRSSTSTWRVRGLGVEIAMTPYRSCAPPPTICSAGDSCCSGAFQRRVFWWRHCSIAAADGDVAEAEAAIERLAAAPADDGSGDTRHLAVAAARTAGAGPRRRDRLSRLSGSLPRHGDIAWLRGAHDVGRGDAMTAALLQPSF